MKNKRNEIGIKRSYATPNGKTVKLSEKLVNRVEKILEHIKKHKKIYSVLITSISGLLIVYSIPEIFSWIDLMFNDVNMFDSVSNEIMKCVQLISKYAIMIVAWVEFAKITILNKQNQ